MAGITTISTLLNSAPKRKKVQEDWLRRLAAVTSARGAISADELAKQTEEFLDLLATATKGGSGEVDSAGYKPLRDFLEGISRSRAQQGFTAAETATFMFSFKQALFEQLRAEAGKTPGALAEEVWTATKLLDELGLHHRQDLPARAARSHQPPAAGNARAVDAGGQAVGRHPGAADDRHARLGAHPDRDGVAAADDRRDRLARSRSSTSPACRRSTRWWPSIC